jgi:hypothetical protein
MLVTSCHVILGENSVPSIRCHHCRKFATKTATESSDVKDSQTHKTRKGSSSASTFSLEDEFPRNLHSPGPMSTPPKVELWLLFNNVEKLALSIPLAECHNFAIYPLKWIRFLGFAIYGCQGYLRIESKTGPAIDNYEAKIEARAYYFVPEGKMDCHMINPG